MSFGGGLFFTNRGRALQAKAQTGIQLNFTRIGVGDGELGGQAIADLTALVHEVKSINLNKFKTLPGGKAVVGGVLSNQGLATSFYWRELGLFATDPDLGEILYCYGNAGALAEYIPAGGGAEILEKQVNIVSLIGNAANVSATIEQSLVFETPEGAQAKADAAQAAAQLYAEGLVENLAGPGNTKTVKQIDDIVTAHLADYVRQPGYAAASGSANAYTVTLSPAPTAYTEGMAISVKINTDNTGASTINVNGLGAKAIKKPNGSNVSAGNLKAGSIYTLRYNGTNFILQGSDAAGNATPADVLSGKTFTNDQGEQTGTMPNRGTVNITPGTSNITIAEGYHSGNGVVYGSANLLPGNIKKDVNIFNVIGTLNPLYTASGQKISSSGTSAFELANGGNRYYARLAVTGLGFTAKVILIYNDANFQTLYSPIDIFSNGGYILVIGSNDYVKVTGYAYVDSTGFCLPVGATSATYNWYAIG